jgi:hypothetical protein
LPELFLDRLWPGLVAWTILYISDYSLTIACARLYQAGARDTIVFEGSYEITPYYQRDINALRRVSPRFLAALLLSLVWLAAVWWLADQWWPPVYPFALGAVILLELAIHMRHVRNLVLFRAIVGSEAVRGRIEYPRRLMLRMSSIELLAFSGLFMVMFLFTGSWFVLGGAATCLSLGGQHLRLARQLMPQPAVR